MQILKIFTGGVAFAVGACAASAAQAEAPRSGTDAGVVADAAGVRNPDDGSKTGQDNSVPAILERFVMGGAFSPDFEEGAFSWKGKKFNLGTSRAARARFERYLTAPLEEYEAERTYRETLAQIEDLLQIINQDKETDKVFQAWQLLYDAAKFPADADGSLLVANQVYNAWSVRGEYTEALRDKVALERQRRALERANAYWTWDTDKQSRDRYDKNFNKELRIQKLESGQGGKTSSSSSSSSQSSDGSDKSSKSTKGGVSVKAGDAEISANVGQNNSSQGGGQGADGQSIAVGMTTAAFAALDLTRTNAEIAALEVGSAAANLRAKLEFQTQIVSFMLQRRFEHALMGIAFYQQIFKGSHQGLEVGKDQISQLIQTNDVATSMRTLEGLAREAQADVRTGMRAVDAAYDAGDRWAALERLQETFFLGEYSADVNSFPTEKRRALLEIYRAARDLQKVGELKDYASVEEILERLRKTAPDFPAAPVLSAVRGAQQSSNIALYTAKQALLTGDAKGAQAAMSQAISLWPLNPAIKDFSQSIAERVDMTAQSAPMFDQFLRMKNYRQIAAMGAEFGLALNKDPERAAQLKAIVTRIAKVDMAIQFAKEALAQGSPYAAWETLLGAQTVEPDDPELARAMSAMAAQAGDFARRLDTAERLLKDGRSTAALANFLAAQDLYPMSQRCRVGVEEAAQAMLRAQAGLPPQ